MVFSSGLGIIDKVFEALAIGVFGSPDVVGVFFLALFFVFGVMLRLPVLVILLLLLPLNIILVSFGYVYLVATAVHVLLILFALGFNFLKQKQ